MYGLFTYIYHKTQQHVGKYTIPVDPMGPMISKHPQKLEDEKTTISAASRTGPNDTEIWAPIIFRSFPI